MANFPTLRTLPTLPTIATNPPNTTQRNSRNMILKSYEVKNWGPHTYQKIVFPEGAKTIALCGENDQGKSWLVRGIAFTLSIARNEYGDQSAIHIGEEEAHHKLIIESGGTIYTIEKIVKGKSSQEEGTTTFINGVKHDKSQLEEFYKETLGLPHPSIWIPICISMQNQTDFHLRSKKRDREEALRQACQLTKIDTWKDGILLKVKEEEKKITEESSNAKGKLEMLIKELNELNDAKEKYSLYIKALTKHAVNPNNQTQREDIPPNDEFWDKIEKDLEIFEDKLKEFRRKKLEISNSEKEVELLNNIISRTTQEINDTFKLLNSNQGIKENETNVEEKIATLKYQLLNIKEQKVKKELIARKDKINKISSEEKIHEIKNKEILSLSLIQEGSPSQILPMELDNILKSLYKKINNCEEAQRKIEQLVRHSDLELPEFSESNLTKFSRTVQRVQKLLNASTTQDINSIYNALNPLLEQSIKQEELQIQSLELGETIPTSTSFSFIGGINIIEDELKSLKSENLATPEKNQGRKTIQANHDFDTSLTKPTKDIDQNQALVTLEKLTLNKIKQIRTSPEINERISREKKDFEICKRVNDILEDLNDSIPSIQDDCKETTFSQYILTLKLKTKNIESYKTYLKELELLSKEKSYLIKELQLWEERLDSICNEKIEIEKTLIPSSKVLLNSNLPLNSGVVDEGFYLKEIETLKQQALQIKALIDKNSKKQIELAEKKGKLELLNKKHEELKTQFLEVEQLCKNGMGLPIPLSSTEEVGMQTQHQETKTHSIDQWETIAEVWLKRLEKYKKTRTLLETIPNRKLSLVSEKLKTMEILEDLELKIRKIESARDLCGFLDYKQAPRLLLEQVVDKLFNVTNQLGEALQVGITLVRGKNLEFLTRQTRAGKILEQKTERLGFGKGAILGICFRLACQKLLLPETGFLILDEPTANVDTKRKAALKGFLQSLSDTEQTKTNQIILIEHDLDVVELCQSKIEIVNKEKDETII